MERACPGVPETWESEVLPSILELLKSQFAELRSHLTAELCDAVRVAATAQSLPSRRESREAELVTRSQASGVSYQVSEGESRSILRPHRGFLSQKLLAELGEEEHVGKPGPLWGDQTLSLHAHHAVNTAQHAVHVAGQPLRNLLRPSTSGITASGPPAPEVHDEPQILSMEVAKVASGVSDSDDDEPAIAPPTEPAPALNSSPSSPHVVVSASPSVSGRRGGTSMTEKAFGLQRGGSITSLDLDRTYWIRVKLLHFVQNVWFETVSMLMLCANAVVIGVQTDYMAINKLSSPPWALRALDIWFCSFFAVELALRILAHGRRFFSMNGCAWNMMDLVLVSAYVTATADAMASQTLAGLGGAAFFPNGKAVRFHFQITLDRAGAIWNCVGDDMQKHIAALELLAQFALTYCIVSCLPRCRGPVSCHQGTDNSAADAASAKAYIAAKGLSMTPGMAMVLSPFFTFMRRFQIFPRVTQIPGYLNVTADSLS